MQMGRRFRGTIAVLASLLLLFQLVMPMGNALAAEEAGLPTSTVETPAPAESTTPAETETPAPPESTTPEETSPAETPAPTEETPEPSEETPPAETPAPSEETTPAEPSAPTEQLPATPPKTLGSNMLPPSNLAFQLLTPDDVKLTWDSVFGATGYNVYGIIDGELKLLGTTAASTFTFNDSPEGTHGFVVSTLSADGESGPSAPVEVTVAYPDMQAPATLTSELKNGNDIVLSWAASEYASTYNVYQIGADGAKTLVTSVTGVTYTVTNAPVGSFTYAVESTNTLYGESALSTPVTVELVHPTMAAPGNVKYTVANGNDVNLKWDAVPYTTSYKVYQVIDGEKVLQKSITGATQTTLANLAAGDYAYVVHAFSDRFGESAEGGAVSLTLVHPTMAAPANFKYSVARVNDVTLTWSAVPFATGYNIYQIVNGQKVLQKTQTGTSALLAALPDGEYIYEVYSFSDRFGESATGSRVSLTVDIPTMQAPENFAYKVQNGNDIVLTWTAAANANSYKIYQVNGDEKVLKSTVTGLTATLANMPAGEYVYEVHSVSTRYGESAEGSRVSLTLTHPTMEAPGNLTQTIVNGNDITLKWDAAPFANNYKVYQIVNGQKVLKNTVTATTVTYANLAAGEYSYVVHAASSRFGESAQGSEVTIPLVHPTMQQPANAKGTINSISAFTLSWDAVAFATSYKVYQVVNGTKTLKSTVSTAQLAFTNMNPGDYTYVVHAVSSRFGESAQGSEITVTLNGVTMEPPTGLNYTIANGNDIVLKWTAAANANSYRVYQIIDEQPVLKSTVSSTTATLTNQAAGEYKFEVRSVSTRYGESENAAAIALTLVHPTVAAPTNLTQKVLNGNDVVLNWTAAANANSYKVYEKIDGQNVLKTTVTGLTATLANVAEGDHAYTVHAFSTRFGESAEGAEVSLTVTYPTMQAPGTLTHTLVNVNDISLKWGAAQYATSYKVYQLLNGEKVLQKTVTNAITTTFVNMPAGDYTYVVHAYSDRFGESAEGSQVSFSMGHPTMQAPGTLTQTIANGNDITLRWGTAQYATAFKLYQIKDGEKVLLRTQTGLTITYANMPAGDYSYVVHSYSDRFGESPEGSPLSFTLVHPTMQAPGTLTQTIANGNDIVLKWGTAQFAKNYRLYQIVNGEKVLLKTLTTLTTTYPNMPEGEYQYVVNSFSDRFGESPEGSLLTFNLVHPTVQPPVVTGTIVNINNITLSWNAVQWANEYRVFRVNGEQREQIYRGSALSFPVYNLSESTHTFEVTAVSTRFGESAASNRITETIIYPEMQAPTANATVLSRTSARISWNFVTYANGYNLYEIVNGEPILIVSNLNALSYTLTNLPYKNRLYYVTSFSNSFGESDPSNTVLAKLVVDEVAPVTTANAPTGWTKDSPVTVKLSATDNDTGVAKTFYSLNGSAFVQGTSVTVNGEGVHRISFYSVDQVDNKEATKTVEVKIDQTAPVTAAQAPTDWSKDGATVNLTATDAHSGVAKTYYSVNGSAYAEGTSVTIEQEGVNQVSFYSVDQTGNQEQAQTIDVKVDKTAPVTIADVPTDWVNEDVTVNLASTDEESGVVKTYYSVNGSEYAEGTIFTVATEGVNEVTFYTVDEAGNKEQTQTLEVKVDKTAPATTSNAPTVWVQEDVTVTLTSTDEHSGVAKTYYSVNGSEYAEGTTFTVATEGVNKVTFYTVDAAGNQEQAQTLEVKVDKTAPATTSNAPTVWVQEDVTVTLTSTDEHSGVAKTYYSVNGSEYAEGPTFTVATEGVNKVTFYSADAAGNTEAVQTAEVKIDRTAPVVALNPSAEFKLGTSVKLSYTATDNQSGIASEKLTVTGPQGEQTLQNGASLTVTKPGVYTVTVTATDKVGLTTTVEKQFVVYIPATISVTPNVIKGNNGVFTVRVDLPSGFSTQGFDLNSVRLNGVKALTSNNGYYNQAKNGQFKFERSDFTWTPSQVALEFRGYVNGVLVVGQTTVKVQK